MSLITRMKKQTCVHWPRIGTDNRGRAVWGTPTERSCRWEDVNEKYTALNGEDLTSRAMVYVDGVKVGDVLMLGTLDASGLNPTDPLRNEKAWEIKRYDSLPNVRNNEVLYTAYL